MQEYTLQMRERRKPETAVRMTLFQMNMAKASTEKRKGFGNPPRATQKDALKAITDAMKNQEMIEGIRKFKESIGVSRAIVFGSFARGEFGEDSDIDLLLVSEKFRGKSFIQRSKGLWLKWDLGLPVDFICFTPEEFKKLKKEVSIVSEAIREGIEV